MKKIIELYILIAVGLIYLMFGLTIPLSAPLVLDITQFICEILKIVLSIAGCILVYNNMYTKTNVKNNNKVKYVANTNLCIGLLAVLEMGVNTSGKCPVIYGNYEIYEFAIEWLQIMMLLVCIRVVNEKIKLVKWMGVQFVIVIFLGVLLSHDYKEMLFYLNNERIQMALRIVHVVIITLLLGMNWKRIKQMSELDEKTFIVLFCIKISVGLLCIMRMITHIWHIQIVEYLFQVAFMMLAVAYIEEISLRRIWAKVETGIKAKQAQALAGQSEQRIMVTASNEITKLIEIMKSKLEGLERQLNEKKDDKGKKFLEKININSNRLLKLSQNILELSAYETGSKQMNFEVTDVKKLISEMVESLEAYVLQKGIHIEFIAKKEAIIADVDQSAIEHIFLNLISNAVKYNKDNGIIKVVLSEKKKKIILCVQDSGIGIPGYHLQDVFNRFKRVDSKYIPPQEGSGLGLSIVKALVDLHHGEIKIASREEKGTIISITLPVHQTKNVPYEVTAVEKAKIENKIKETFPDINKMKA